jgi:hypothetical protein
MPRAFRGARRRIAAIRTLCPFVSILEDVGREQTVNLSDFFIIIDRSLVSWNERASCSEAPHFPRRKAASPRKAQVGHATIFR